MNQRTEQILYLNKKFYQSVAKDFSISRQKDWRGWNRAVQAAKNHLKEPMRKNGPKILDLGCGNGRFLKFLIKRIPKFYYKGYDINNDLLKEAKINSKSTNKIKIRFIKKDILKNILIIKSKSDFIVSFGFTHHIPDHKLRKNWFTYLPKILKKDGVLVLTFWSFANKSGDYLVSWKNENIARYCHQYSKKELKTIISMYKKSGLRLIDKYEADNKNIYLIFGKI